MRLSEQFKDTIRKSISVLQAYVSRWWYPPFIGFLAALDNIVVIIPNDGILISSAMLAPKKWLRISVWVAVGSTLGAVFLAHLVQFHGMQIGRAHV